VSELLEKARADYDAGFSSAYHDGVEKGRDEGLDLSTEIIGALLKQTPTEEIAARYNTSIQKVNNLRSALTQVSA